MKTPKSQDDKYDENPILVALYDNLTIMASVDHNLDPNVEFLKLMAHNHGFPKKFVEVILGRKVKWENE